jgi:hypothetical protein
MGSFSSNCLKMPLFHDYLWKQIFTYRIRDFETFESFPLLHKENCHDLQFLMRHVKFFVPSCLQDFLIFISCQWFECSRYIFFNLFGVNFLDLCFVICEYFWKPNSSNIVFIHSLSLLWNSNHTFVRAFDFVLHLMAFLCILCGFFWADVTFADFSLNYIKSAINTGMILFITLIVLFFIANFSSNLALPAYFSLLKFPMYAGEFIIFPESINIFILVTLISIFGHVDSTLLY